MHFVQSKGFWTPAGNVSDRHNSLGVASRCRGGLLMLPYPSILMCETLGWKIERASPLQLPRKDASHDSKVLRSLSPDIRHGACVALMSNSFKWGAECSLLCWNVQASSGNSAEQWCLHSMCSRSRVQCVHESSFPTRDRFQDTVYDVRRVCGKGLPSNVEPICLEAFFLISLETSRMETLINHCLT